MRRNVCWLGLCLALAFTRSAYSTKDTTVRVIIMNQVGQIHIDLANKLKESIESQTTGSREVLRRVEVSTLHPDCSHIPGGWTYLPLIRAIDVSADWIFFCTEFININMSELESCLEKQDPTGAYFGGVPLRDDNPSIVHHYDIQEDFYYPDITKGFILSRGLLRLLTDSLKAGNSPPVDFTMDPTFELALYIQTNLDINMKFCTQRFSERVSWPPVSLLYSRSSLSAVQFAIKTWRENHSKRLPHLLSTWLLADLNAVLFSDTTDNEYGTVSTNIMNTERGHCGKTEYIMKWAASLSNFTWLVIADDDTMMNTEHLARLLLMYDSSKSVVIGERYGYQQWSGHGYTYPTGGSGMIFSNPAVHELASCRCPSIDSPDDMILGRCMSRRNIPFIHTSKLHQASPDEYPSVQWDSQDQISFHSFFGMKDPTEVWRQKLRAIPGVAHDEF